MAYNTTGKSHSNGIGNEVFVQNKLSTCNTNSFGNCPDVEKRGGTSNKEDLAIPSGNKEVKISCKNNSHGTYDYSNTSNWDNEKYQKAKEEVRKLGESVRESFSGTPKDFKNSQEKKELKKSVKNTASDLLDSFGSDDIKDIIEEQAFGSYFDEGWYFTVTDKQKNINIFQTTNLPAIEDIAAGKVREYKFKKLKGIESRKVIAIHHDGTEHDYGLRVRAVTNNGIGALAGKNEGKNNNSTFVIKVQQDSPMKHLPAASKIEVV